MADHNVRGSAVGGGKAVVDEDPVVERIGLEKVGPVVESARGNDKVHAIGAAAVAVGQGAGEIGLAFHQVGGGPVGDRNTVKHEHAVISVIGNKQMGPIAGHTQGSTQNSGSRRTTAVGLVGDKIRLAHDHVRAGFVDSRNSVINKDTAVSGVGDEKVPPRNPRLVRIAQGLRGWRGKALVGQAESKTRLPHFHAGQGAVRGGPGPVDQNPVIAAIGHINRDPVAVNAARGREAGLSVAGRAVVGVRLSKCEVSGRVVRGREGIKYQDPVVAGIRDKDGRARAVNSLGRGKIKGVSCRRAMPLVDRTGGKGGLPQDFVGGGEAGSGEAVVDQDTVIGRIGDK